MTVIEKDKSMMTSNKRPGITDDMIQSAIGIALQDAAFSEMDEAQKSAFADEINRVYYYGIEVGTLVSRLRCHTLSLDQIEALDGIDYHIDRIHNSVKSAPLCIQSADWLETLALAVKGKACDLYFEHAVYINRFDQIESPELQKRLADNLRTAVGDQFFNSTVHGVLVNGGLIFINMPSVAEKVLQCLMHNAELKEAGLFVAHFDRNGDLIETN